MRERCHEALPFHWPEKLQKVGCRQLRGLQSPPGQAAQASPPQPLGLKPSDRLTGQVLGEASQREDRLGLGALGGSGRRGGLRATGIQGEAED